MRHLLLTTLQQPDSFASLPLGDWDLIVRQARHAGVLARICFLLEDRGLLDRVPREPRCHLESARTLAHKQTRDVRWEVTSVRAVLDDIGVPITLLKGAAYVMAGLPPARGRLFNDIDFMVPRESIDQVEAALLAADWIAGKLDPYDQRYYRNWTHQIPPLRHVARNTILDVHHTIVAVTSRSAVDALALSADSLPLGGDERLRVLAPVDMVLHSAVHLFNEGEFDHGLRDLLDLRDLLEHFGSAPGFWDDLVQRAAEIGLTRPLFYSLRYLEKLLKAPIPSTVLEASAAWSPTPLRLADALFTRALLPNHRTCDDRFTGMARWLLYVRAHHLRMPARLLVPHLLRKAIHRRIND